MHRPRKHITKIFTCPDCEGACDGKTCKCGWIKSGLKKAKQPQIIVDCKYCGEPAIIGNCCQKHFDKKGLLNHIKYWLNFRNGTPQDFNVYEMVCNLFRENFDGVLTKDKLELLRKHYQRKAAQRLKKNIVECGQEPKSVSRSLEKYVNLEPNIFSEDEWDEYRIDANKEEGNAVANV